ncbi:MAG: glycosyltransferase [Clostridia bacterium]|nr:glycosyltransferase [Clostridia bacterium]
MKISVIVPVYKVEKYINQCVESILNQTFEDFELILVDDGSPDNSGAICDELALTDGRIVCIHKENGGLSSARNAGIDMAKGDYIAFVDSDDIIDKEMLQVMYSNIVKYNADISGIEYAEFSQDLPQLKKNKIIKFKQKNLMEFIMQKNRLYCVVRYLYKKSILQNQRFDCDIKLGEDQIFIFDYVLKCGSLVMSDYNGYYYRRNINSLSNGQLKSSCIGELDNRLKMIEKLDKKTKKYGQAHYWKGVVAYWTRAVVYGTAEGFDFESIYTKEIKKNALRIIFSRHIELKYKAICMLMCLGEKNAKKILKKALADRW